MIFLKVQGKALVFGKIFEFNLLNKPKTSMFSPNKIILY